MNFKTCILFTLSINILTIVTAQKTIPLYSGIMPNSRPCDSVGSSNSKGINGGVSIPVLFAYFPEKGDSSNTAVIICPGGGYAGLAMEHEGRELAMAYNKRGITAFVLKYRLPVNRACIENPETVALMDAQQAIKIVRENANTFKINPNKIGVMGFSAGGHLASTLGTHFSNSLIPNQENTILRPDFLVLAYPVISFTDSLCHKGSRTNMLGKNPSEEKIRLYSNEFQVTTQTPPTFLIHAADDKAVKVENSLEFFLALKKNNVPSEIHILQKGGHGFGLHNKPEPSNWLEEVFVWMKANHFLK